MTDETAAPATPAHDQAVVNRYVVHYPAHAPRKDDPHYHAFEAYRKAHLHWAVCYVGQRVGYDECADAQGHLLPNQPGSGQGLELHHHYLEFAVINAVDLEALQKDYPDLTDPAKVADWAESDVNFMWLCAKHHRGQGGAHHASFADFDAELYVKNLIS